MITLAPAPRSRRLTLPLQAGLPPTDAPILAAALPANADLLVTGDRTHFGHLYGRPIGRLVVHRPSEALSAVLLDAKVDRQRRQRR